MSELDKLRRSISEYVKMISSMVKMAKSGNFDSVIGHYLIIMEIAIEEFENLCSIYEEISGSEHPEWTTNGEFFSDEWKLLDDAINGKDKDPE